MTYREICDRLSRASIDSAEWDARLLLEHFCPADAMRYLLDRDLAFDASEALKAAVARREARYPLQYILGEWGFFRQVYEVCPDCLIPRPDTEILVEDAIRTLPRGACFADLCTGSGCIAVSVLAERPDTSAIAVDKFAHTLAVAERNAVKNRVRDRFSPICADVLDPSLPFGEECSLDAILCNPPYIPSATVDTLDAELFSEPRAALDGGEDGLIFYRALLQNAAKLLKPDGFFLFEIGFDQAEALRSIGTEHGFDGYRLLRDLGGCDRVVRLWREGAYTDDKQVRRVGDNT